MKHANVTNVKDAVAQPHIGLFLQQDGDNPENLREYCRLVTGEGKEDKIVETGRIMPRSKYVRYCQELGQEPVRNNPA